MLLVYIKLKCSAVRDRKHIKPFTKFFLKTLIHFVIEVFLTIDRNRRKKNQETLHAYLCRSQCMNVFHCSPDILELFCDISEQSQS